MKVPYQVPASLFEFISLTLIEKKLFQGNAIPMMTLMYLANDLLKALKKEQTPKEKLNLRKELMISYKQLLGTPLTPEEEIYDSQIHELDVTGEVLSGIRYAALFTLGQNLYNTMSSALTLRLWNHIPSIAGYMGATALGPYVLSTAIEKTLSKCNLDDEQKASIRPWLNTMGRLALGFVPRVSSSKDNIVYRYPSTEGLTSSYSQKQTVHQKGNRISVENVGNKTVDTPDGPSSVDDFFEMFNLDGIIHLSEHSIRIIITKENGTKVPVTLSIKNNNGVSSFTINSTYKDIEQQWETYFNNCNYSPNSYAIT